ncbi:MAG TPA: 8-amino-7-oxononanoate synthase [Xanthomonadaceae bacterium]|nr:8-amino-7-oxononanoate synthase [Xanthomonadaceae bacterium]
MRPRPAIRARLAAAAAARAEAHLTRRLREVDAIDGMHLGVDGQRLLSFAGNDYLGLAGHPLLREALKAGVDRWGLGSTASALVCGRRAAHHELEQALADWTGYPRALLFASGYQCALAVLPALLGRDDLCVQDRLNHACLIDGARLSGAALKRYPHLDVDGAARQLGQRPEAAALLATDSVFSMDGDQAPLAGLARLAADEGAMLLIDDAHGLGVLGHDGAGSVAAAGLGPADVPLLMGTLGKALGSFGAFVAAEDAIIDALIQEARGLVYSTAPPPALAAATLAAVAVARSEGWRRERVQMLIARVREGAAALDLPLLPSATPIQPVLLGAAERVLKVAETLREAGLWVPAIRPPTVPAGRARLRISLSAGHSEADIDRLLDALAQALKAHPS